MRMIARGPRPSGGQVARGAFWFGQLNMTRMLAGIVLFIVLMLVLEHAIFAPLERRAFAWRRWWRNGRAARTATAPGRGQPAPPSLAMHTAPVPLMPIALAAPRLRSSETPRTNGPRSLTVTVTDLPLRGLTTISRVPNGR